jgi:hypothetical protein
MSLSWRALLVRLLSVLMALGLSVLLLLLGNGDDAPGRPHSSLNRSDAGWSAWRRMLEELGYPARTFELPPGKAGAGEMLLVLPGVPEQSEQQQALPDHERSQYRRFLENGGTLLAPADEALLAFLSIELELAISDELSIAESSSVEPWEASLPTGERLKLAGGTAFEPLDESGAWREVVLGSRPGESERPLVVEAGVGAGRLVLVSDPTLFENGNIRQLDHALYAVRLAELFSAGLPICFDEFSLGAWSPPSAIELALRGPNAWISVHLLLLAGLFVWMRAHTAAFARDPLPLTRSSALERARQRARSLARAQLVGAAARLDLEAFVSREEQRLGLRTRGQATLEQRLAALAARRPECNALVAHAVELPRDADALERLHEQLQSLQPHP